MKRLAILVLAMAFTFACGPSAQEAKTACEDFFNEAARYSVKCDSSATIEGEKAKFKAAANVDSDCSNVVSIRDKDALYTNCIPAIRSAQCDLQDFTTVMQGSYCRSQLLIQQ